MAIAVVIIQRAWSRPLLPRHLAARQRPYGPRLRYAVTAILASERSESREPRDY